MRHRNEHAARGLLRYYFTTGVFEALAALVILLKIPADEKFVWLFGYSQLRLGLILAFLLVIGLFTWLAVQAWKNEKFMRMKLFRLDHLESEFRYSFPLLLIVFVVMTFSHYWYALTQASFEGLPLRVAPFIFLLLTRTTQTLIVTLVASFFIQLPSSDQSKRTTSLVINPRKIAFILGFIAAMLVVLSIIGDIMELSIPWDRAAVRYNKKFNVDLEQTIPTYYSSLILLIAGILLTLIAVIKRKARDSYFIHWSILAIIFWYMSVDETVSLHEFLIKPLRGIFNTSGFLYFAWVIAAIPLLVLLAIAYRRFLLSLPSRIKLEFLAAAMLYLASALGLEMIGGWYFEQFGGNQIPYILLTTVEETLEMAGIVIFIHALLKYLDENFPEIQVSIRESRPALK